MFSVQLITADRARELLTSFARVLKACVDAGASVSFLAPLSPEEAEQFFAGVVVELAAGRRILLAAFEGESLIGTVQVVTAMPPNQLHRGEIAKLLVSPSARGKGVGAALMLAAEEHAKLAGKTLLVLDTCEGGKAEALYLRLGWTKVGVIPDYALFPDGSPCDTVVFFKRLSSLS